VTGQSSSLKLEGVYLDANGRVSSSGKCRCILHKTAVQGLVAKLSEVSIRRLKLSKKAA
jgi:hypothetical protein